MTQTAEPPPSDREPWQYSIKSWMIAVAVVGVVLTMRRVHPLIIMLALPFTPLAIELARMAVARVRMKQELRHARLALGDRRLTDAETKLRSAYQRTEGRDPARVEMRVADALRSAGNQARNDGQVEDAELLFRRAEEASENGRGRDHIDTAECLGELADVLVVQGKLDEARLLLASALAIEQQYLGEFHPGLAGTLNVLSEVCCRLGLAEEAQQLAQRSSSLAKMLDLGQTETVSALIEQAQALRVFDKFVEAQELLERALSLLEEHLEHDDPFLERVLEPLAINAMALHRYRVAEEHFRRRAAIVEQYAGRHDAKTAAARTLLAWSWLAQGRLKEATALLNEVGVVLQKSSDVKGYQLANYLSMAAISSREGGQPDKAEAFARQGLEVCQKHNLKLTQAASFWLSLAYACRKQGQLEQAASWARKVRRAAELQENDRLLTSALSCQAQIEESQQSFDQASALLEESLAMRRRLYGATHGVVGECSAQLANVRRQQRRLEEAHRLGEEALAVVRQCTPQNPLAVALALHVMGTICADQGDRVQAKEFLREATALRAEALEPNHPDLLESRQRYESVAVDPPDGLGCSYGTIAKFQLDANT